MGAINTFVFSPIRRDYIFPALDSLKEHTPSNYKTIVVNQTKLDAEFDYLLWTKSDLTVRAHYNYGFAQSQNLGTRLATTEYVTVANDDVIFLDGWWKGIMETFERIPNAIGVAPMSPKEPGWGYGELGYRYLIPCMEEYRNYEKRYEFLKTLDELKTDRDLKQEFHQLERELDQATLELSQIPENINQLIKNYKGAVIDGIAMWLVVYKRKEWVELGMFDERFRLGGGEDYDALCRQYQAGYRAVASSLSWVWHWWGQSTTDVPPEEKYKDALPPRSPGWNKLSTKGFGAEGLWDPDCHIWGQGCTRTDPNVYRAPL